MWLRRHSRKRPRLRWHHRPPRPRCKGGDKRDAPPSPAEPGGGMGTAPPRPPSFIRRRGGIFGIPSWQLATGVAAPCAKARDGTGTAGRGPCPAARGCTQEGFLLGGREVTAVSTAPAMLVAREGGWGATTPPPPNSCPRRCRIPREPRAAAPTGQPGRQPAPAPAHRGRERSGSTRSRRGKDRLHRSRAGSTVALTSCTVVVSGCTAALPSCSVAVAGRSVALPTSPWWFPAEPRQGLAAPWHHSLHRGHARLHRGTALHRGISRLHRGTAQFTEAVPGCTMALPGCTVAPLASPWHCPAAPWHHSLCRGGRPAATPRSAPAAPSPCPSHPGTARPRRLYRPPAAPRSWQRVLGLPACLPRRRGWAAPPAAPAASKQAGIWQRGHGRPKGPRQGKPGAAGTAAHRRVGGNRPRGCWGGCSPVSYQGGWYDQEKGG